MDLSWLPEGFWKMGSVWPLVAFFSSGFISGFPIIGFVFPVSVFQIALSSACASLHITLVGILVVVVPAIVMGDFCAYLIGRFLHRRIEKKALTARHEKLMERGHYYLDRYGGIALILGRIMGPIRTVTPITSGIMQMSFGRFFLFDTLAALLWFTMHVLPFYYIVDWLRS